MIKIGKNISEFSVHSCQPKTKDELKDIIRDRIKEQGTECDLNDIDVSLIDDMAYMFYEMDFNGDIYNWNVSNVKNVCCMFAFSSFNQDISNWNIRKDCDTREMFYNCPIKEEFKPELPE